MFSFIITIHCVHWLIHFVWEGGGGGGDIGFLGGGGGI